jgi:hypothetical protein
VYGGDRPPLVALHARPRSVVRPLRRGAKAGGTAGARHDQPSPGGYDPVVHSDKGGDRRAAPLMGEPLASMLAYLKTTVKGWREVPLAY